MEKNKDKSEFKNEEPKLGDSKNEKKNEFKINYNKNENIKYNDKNEEKENSQGNNNSKFSNINFKLLAIEIFKKQNKVLTNPKSYIEKLEKATNFFKDKIFRYPGEKPIETFEGVKGVYDAIEFLQKQNPVKPLIYSPKLTQACEDHAKDIGINNLSSHKGSNGNNINERIEKNIEWDGAIAENLGFCYAFPENIIMDLIIDDSSEDKHQRNNLILDLNMEELPVMSIKFIK